MIPEGREGMHVHEDVPGSRAEIICVENMAKDFGHYAFSCTHRIGQGCQLIGCIGASLPAHVVRAVERHKLLEWFGWRATHYLEYFLHFIAYWISHTQATFVDSLIVVRKILKLAL